MHYLVFPKQRKCACTLSVGIKFFNFSIFQTRNCTTQSSQLVKFPLNSDLVNEHGNFIS